MAERASVGNENVRKAIDWQYEHTSRGFAPRTARMSLARRREFPFHDMALPAKSTAAKRRDSGRSAMSRV